MLLQDVIPAFITPRDTNGRCTQFHAPIEDHIYLCMSLKMRCLALQCVDVVKVFATMGFAARNSVPRFGVIIGNTHSTDFLSELRLRLRKS